ncbi:MAG TPA: hypothetical protein VFT64_05050 [Rickettsiales bacterium]|nr:hypothetical protein [Rickettsiales bacterium]
MQRSDYFSFCIGKNFKIPGIVKLTLLICLLLITGIDHDPWWKRGEAYSFGVIYNFYITHTWIIPMNAGVPFMEKPPLYYWTAVLCMKLFGGILPLHDAARLASLPYLILTGFFIWKTAKTLFQDHDHCDTLSKITVYLLLGTYGYIRFSHVLITDTALVAGTAIALYGIALQCKTPMRYLSAGCWLGIGLGIAFMSKGLVIPTIMGISGIILWLTLTSLHNRYTWRALLIAGITISPFLLIWPYLVYTHSPELFHDWLWDNNIGRFFGSSVARLGAENRPGYFIWMAPLYAFPVFPLACVHIVRARKEWRTPEYLLPVSVSYIGLLVLLISASGRAPYLLPLMPGFALLAAQAVMRFSDGCRIILNKILLTAFSVAAATTWLIWWTLHYPRAHRPLVWLSSMFKKLPPDFIPPASQGLACLVALLAALFWISCLRLEKHNPLNLARIWFLGALLMWCTIYTLLMPWINESMSYLPVLKRLDSFIQKSGYSTDCIGDIELGENIAPLIQYYYEKTPWPRVTWENSRCPLILAFMPREASEDAYPQWKMVWKDSHLPSIKNMDLRLYKRN